MWWCQFIDCLKFETRPSSLLNSGTAYGLNKKEGAFHSTKFSGLKFWVFHATNGTVFSGSKFGAKTEDSFTFVYLLSGCSIDDAEVKINDVLGEGDNTTYNLS